MFFLCLFLGVPVAPQAGQADYSAQWIEYYRSMGMTREAETIEQQIRVRNDFWLFIKIFWFLLKHTKRFKAH